MSLFQNSTLLLLLGLAIPLLIGLAVAILGGSMAFRWKWVVLVALVLLCAVIGVNLAALADRGFAPLLWMRGWILPHESTGAIGVGILQDGTGLVITGLCSVFGIIFLLGLRESGSVRIERVAGSVGVAVAGIGLAWNSLTPWLSIAGIAWTVFAGLLMLSSQWDTESESVFAARFGWERLWGVAIAVAGMAALASSRNGLSWTSSSPGATWSDSSSSPFGNPFETAAAATVMAGLFALTRARLEQKTAAGSSSDYYSAKVLVTQLFPAVAAFGAIFRFEPNLRAFGVFPVFGWVALFSAFLNVISGLFQAEWKASFSQWISGAFGLLVAALAFSTPVAAMAMLIGFVSSAVVLVLCFSALEAGGSQSHSNRKRAVWAKAGCVAAALMGSGMIGFVSAGGVLRWLIHANQIPGAVPVSAFCYFGFVVLVWRNSWAALRSRQATQASWIAVLSPWLLIVLTLGVFWMGTASGGMIYGSPDQILVSVLGLFYKGGESDLQEYSVYSSASIIFGVLLVLGWISSFWLSGRKQDLWMQASRKVPRASAFITSGFGVDFVMLRLRTAVNWLGVKTEQTMGNRLWNRWLSGALGVSVRTGGRLVARWEATPYWKTGAALDSAFAVPSKLLQIIQNGDVQWYLFFGLGIGAAIILHFLRST